MSASARASLLILGSAAFTVSADARVIDPLLRVIANQFHVEVGQAAIVVSAYTLPYGMFQLFYGPLGDRIGKLRVMAVALTLFAIGTAACALVTNLALFAVLRFLTGVVAAAIIPLSLAYVGDKFPYEQRQAALGRFMSALMLGQIVSASLGGIFGDFLTWRGIFLVFGVCALLISLGLWREAKRYPEEKKATSRLGWATYAPHRQLLKQPNARLVYGGVLLEGFLLIGGLAYLGASLKDRFTQLSYFQIGLMLGLYGIGGILYSLSVKSLVRRLGELGLVVLGGVLMCAAFLTIAFLPTWGLFIPASLLLGFGFNSLHSTLQTKATELAPTARGMAVSLFAFAFFLGQSSGVAFLGRVIEWKGYPAAFALAGVLLLLLSLWLRTQFPRLPKPAPPKPAT